jgi:hypothetical protein
VSWPESGVWAPLAEGVVDVLDRPYGLEVVDCGELAVPSGRLGFLDPLTAYPEEFSVVEVPPGRYPVKLTLADVSGSLSGADVRAAYLSVILSDAPESDHRLLTEAEEDDEEFSGVAVESDAVAIVDQEAFLRCVPERRFDRQAQVWADQLEDPDEIRNGAANLELPDAEEGETIVLAASTWGDGLYPIMGSFDEDGRLVAVHLDLQVVGTFAPEYE